MADGVEPGFPVAETRHHALDPRLTLSLRIAFYAVAALSLASLIATFNEIGAFDRLMDDATAAAVSSVADAEQLSEGFVTLVVWVGLLTGVLTITWWYRAFRAIELVEPPDLRWSRGWAVGGWLIPFANLVIPKLVLDDVDRVAAAAEVGVSDWRRQRRLPLTAWWWGFWVGGLIIGVIATRTLGGEIDNPAFDAGTYRLGLIGLMVTHACSTIAAFLAAASLRIIGARLHSA
jgi:hypothetical protein